MPTTCPRCGTLSAATSESCRECGRDLYRVAYPAPASLRLNPLRTPRQIAIGAAFLVAGAGISTGMLMQDSQEGPPTSQDRVPATAVPREPTYSPPPPPPEPTKTKETPPKPAPTTTQPSTPPATPSPTQSTEQPAPGFSEAEDALELARQISEQYDDRDGEGSYYWNGGGRRQGHYNGPPGYGYGYGYQR